MDPNTAPAPAFVASLEAMIQASTSAILDRRLGPASDDLNARIEAAVATALDRRLGPEVGSLGNRMTSLVEQRLTDAVESLNDRVTSSVAVALDQRLGPAGGALCAQITFTSAPFPTLPQLEKAQPDASDGSKSTASQPVADGLRKSEAIPRVLFKAKPDCKTATQSSSLADTPNKRKANQKDQESEVNNTRESESSSLEEENDSNGKPITKRARFDLDPPGYTKGPPIQFRRIFLTLGGHTRGYPRIIDLHSFTEASNKEDFTMADVVATFLFNYDPLSLDAFMDMETFSAFGLIRTESDRKTRPLVIQRHRESSGMIVKVFDLDQIARTRLLTNKIVRVSPSPCRSCQVPPLLGNKI